MPRRDFLRLALAGSAGALTAQPLGNLFGATGGGNRAEVIVIGAGMSGIAAAQRLARHGLKVIVLEGRERLGGRIWSDRQMRGATLDMGACWIHGAESSPLS
ncbi:MAG: FAD-dependent oxidoreductase, partial [Chthoniobacterales bacterium]